MSPGGMGPLADQAAREADAALHDEELKLLATTTIDWERLRPRVENQEVFDRLQAAVQAATDRNESIAQLRDRIAGLGSEGIGVLRKVKSLLAAA